MKEIKDPRMRGGGSSKIRKYILENHKCFVFFSVEYIGCIPAKPNNKTKHSQCSLHIHLHLFCSSLSSGSIRLLVCCWLGSIISSSSCPSSSPSLGCEPLQACGFKMASGFQILHDCLAIDVAVTQEIPVKPSQSQRRVQRSSFIVSITI